MFYDQRRKASAVGDPVPPSKTDSMLMISLSVIGQSNVLSNTLGSIWTLRTAIS